jgi:hypothetical protein
MNSRKKDDLDHAGTRPEYVLPKKEEFHKTNFIRQKRR